MRHSRLRLVGLLLLVPLVALAAAVIGAAPAEPPPPLPTATQLKADQAKFLGLAEAGVRKVNRLWWNSRAGWYVERLRGRSRGASIWTTVHLFNTLDAIALASPTPAHRRMLTTFADRAQRAYWNPLGGHIRHTRLHVGGYSPGPGQRGPGRHLYYDDNGWLGLAFLDAYRATRIRRDLDHAQSAFEFTAKTGWADGAGGGVGWDPRHMSRSSEGIASNTLLAALLYETTHKRYYLRTARRYIAWADSHIWDRRSGLYMRDPNSPILMRYVQSPMIAAYESLCESTRDDRWCDKAERLGAAALAGFPAAADHGPQYDAVYLRWMLDLYDHDGDPRWYSLAYYNAERALAKAGNRAGLFLRAWDGSRAPDAPADSLKIESATLSVFAWLAAAKPPTS